MTTLLPAAYDSWDTLVSGSDTDPNWANKVQDVLRELSRSGRNAPGRVFDVRSYGDWKGVTRRITASISASSTTLTGSFVAGDAGAWIVVYGAALGGRPHRAQIIGLNGALTVATLSLAAEVTVSGAVVELCWYDDTASVALAGAALQANGGGTLSIPTTWAGALTIVGNDATTPTRGGALLQFTGLQGVRVVQRQGVFIDTQSYTDGGHAGGGGDYSSLVELRDCQLVDVDLRILAQQQGVLAGGAFGGPITAVLLGDTTLGRVRVRNVGALYAVAMAYAVTPGVDGPSLIDVDVDAAYSQYTCVHQYGGSHSRVRVRAEQCGRSFFAYGVRDVKAHVHATNQQIQTILDATGDVPTEDIELWYYDHSPTTVSPVNNPAAQVWVNIQGTSPQTHRNIRLHVDMDLVAGGYGDGIAIAKQVSSGGSADTTGRGHVVDGVSIDGYVNVASTRYAVAAGSGISGGIYGDYKSTDTVSRLHLDGLNVAQGLISVDLGDALQDMARIDGLVCAGNVTLNAASAPGGYSLRDCIAPTITAPASLSNGRVCWSQSGTAPSALSDMDTHGVGRYSGAGSPETVVTANVGSTYARTNGGAGTSWYVKESGTGNTGWTAK